MNVDYNALSNACKRLVGYIQNGKSSALSHAHIRSFAEVYDATRYAIAKGTSIATVLRFFHEWQNNRIFMKLRQREYLYMIWTLENNLVNWNTYFRKVPKPFTGLFNKSSVYRNNHEAYIEMLLFFTQYNFSETAAGLGDAEKARLIKNLEVERSNAMTQSWLLNPYEFTQYFKYAMIPVGEKYIVCNEIADVPRPDLGAMMLASKEALVKNFHEATFGLFDFKRHKDRKFPHANVLIAGGFVNSLLRNDYKNIPAADVDMFVHGMSLADKKSTFQLLLEWFDSPYTFYAINGGVVTIYIVNIKRKFQIINTDKIHAHDIFKSFDMSHIQTGIQFDEAGDISVVMTPDACYSLKHQYTRYKNAATAKAERVIKALTRGYAVQDRPDVLDISGLIADPKSEQMLSHLVQVYGYYTPRIKGLNNGDPISKHAALQIMYHISTDANTRNVTQSKMEAFTGAIINCSFDMSYARWQYNNFREATIVNTGFVRGRPRIDIRSNMGLIKLISAELKVDAIVSNAEEITITCSIPADSADFVNFVQRLETSVFRMFVPNGEVSRKIIQNNTIKFVFNAEQIRINRLGQTNHGDPITVQEDVCPGDTVRVLFNIAIANGRDNKYIMMLPRKVIKYVSDAEFRASNISFLPRDGAIPAEAPREKVPVVPVTAATIAATSTTSATTTVAGTTTTAKGKGPATKTESDLNYDELQYSSGSDNESDGSDSGSDISSDSD